MAGMLQETDFLSYLNALIAVKENYIIVFCSKNNIGMRLSADCALKIKELGFQSNLHRDSGLSGNSHRTFIGIIDGGVVTCEKLGLPEVYDSEYTDGDFFIKSTVWHNKSCRDAVIIFNKKDYCMNFRGLNIVLIDKQDFTVKDSVCFDCYKEPTVCRRSEEIYHEKPKMKRLDAYQPRRLPELALYRPQYPYSEMAVVAGMDMEQSRLKQYAVKESMYYNIIGGNVVLSMNEMKVDKDGVSYLFSGITRVFEHLIVGDKDVSRKDVSVEDLREGIGEFELLYWKDGRLELSTDYFGMCQWFYYQSGDVIAAATSYHLLLLILKELQRPLKLDCKKTAAGMAFFGTFVEQNFSDRMDVENCYVMSADKRLVIPDGRKPYFENNSLYKEIREPEPYSEEAYEKYLYLAAEELRANTKAVLLHDAFDYVVCDLSGGMDSRIVLASMLHQPLSLLKNLRIFSNLESKADFTIADEIVKIYGLQWEDIPKEKQLNGVKLEDNIVYQQKASFNLGTRFWGGSILTFDTIPKSIRLTGGCSVCMKRGYSFQELNETLVEHLDKLGVEMDMGRSGYAGTALKELAYESIQALPGKSLKEKKDLHYLLYRNRYQYKNKYRTDAVTWCPLQSKMAFHLRQMYFTNRLDGKIAYDIVHILNPVLSNLPYESQRYNTYLKKNINLLYHKGYPRVQLGQPDNVDDLEDKKYKYPVSGVSDIEETQGVKFEMERFYNSEEILLSALKVFLQYSEHFAEFEEPLYQYITSKRYKEKNDKRYKTNNMRVNRLLSICWQIQLIDGMKIE